MYGLTSLSWAPNTGFLRAIQAISSRAIQAISSCPSTTGQSYSTLSGTKLKTWGGGGIRPGVFSLLSPPSLKTSTVPSRLAYMCFFRFQGLEI